MKKITEADFVQLATSLNVSVAAIKAVAEVEGSGSGFLLNGNVIIRFEPHLFSRYTDRKFDKTNPQLSYQPWRAGNPRSTAHSWELFTEASKLDANAAVRATSWGMFQILGDNFRACGCQNLTEFVAKMEQSEGQQLILFGNFIRSMGLVDELQRQDWAGFARVYNGPSYRVNKYDAKLATAFARHSK